jgi:hypothetical protein
MILAIPLSLAVGAFAMWLLMRERTNAALHLASYYKTKWQETNEAPKVARPVDPVWAEFLREQWS